MYQIEVLVREETGNVWRPMRPTNAGKPYEFETRDRAERMARMCYGVEHRDKVRVRSVTMARGLIEKVT